MSEQNSLGRSCDYPRRHKWSGPRWLTILLIIFALIVLIYSLALPLGEAADESEHFALIRFIAEEHRPPLTLKEQHDISAKGDASPVYHGLVALITQHVDVSVLPELPDPRRQLERAIPYDRLPFKGLYHTEDEAFPFRGIVLAWHLARLISIPLAILTIIAVYMTVLTIYPNRPYLALAAAGFAAFIPRFVINSAIISDDNLVLPLVAFAIYALVRITQGDERPRSFIILGILTGLAGVAKYHSLLLVPLMTVVLALLARQNHWGWRLGLRRWSLIMLAFLLTAGWWFTFLVIRFNRVEDLGWFRGLIAPLGDPVIAGSVDRLLNVQTGSNLAYEVELGWFEWAGLLFRTFWFRYGRGHVIDSPVVNWGLGLITLIAVLGLAWTGLRSRKQVGARLRDIRNWRLDMILLTLYVLVYFSLVVTRYVTLPTRETAQGRHLYPALTAIAFFFMLGLSQIPHLFRRLPGRRAWLPKKEWSRPAYDKILALGVSGVLVGFTALTLPLFIIPVYTPYLPISSLHPAEAPIQQRTAASFAAGLDFEGYTLSSSTSKAGEALPVTLYWYAGAMQERDYLVRLCLHDTSGQPAACRQGHPADGRYPMRAWEAGYLIRDQIYLPTPYCLPAGNYELRLSVLPLRLDTASTEVAEGIEVTEAVSLGWVALFEGQREQPVDFDLWLGDERYSRGQIELRQIRQALTAINYQRPESRPDDVAQIRLSPTPADPVSKVIWSPATSPTGYTCSDGTVATMYNFIVDPSIEPNTYYPTVANNVKPEPLVTVLTHPRNFSLPVDISTRVNTSFGGEVELLGYNLDLSPHWPGDIIDIEVYWRSLSTMKRRYVGSFHLLDPSVQMWGQIDHILGNNYEYPNVLWAPGEVINQVYQLPIEKQTPPGLYTIEFGVYDNSFGDFNFLPVTRTNDPEPAKQLYLGQIRVMDPARTQPPDQPMTVELGDQFQLLGFDLASEQLAPGEALKLALHWQATSQPTADYTVFTQLVGPDGLVWGQQDNQPQGGRYPTTSWAVRDRVVDRYELTLGKGAPPGQYRLLAGMYDLVTGQRLPAISEDGHQLPGNAILLTTLIVE